ncbi:MAG: hypothetical protein AAFQ65_08610 [Myxococcota bacterium]
MLKSCSTESLDALYDVIARFEGMWSCSARGGHTLQKHVGKTDGELRARLEREPGTCCFDSLKTLPIVSAARAAGLGSTSCNGYAGFG